jgi:hypothetical protein
MKAHRRLVLAAGVGLVLTCGLVVVLVLLRGQGKEAERVPAEGIAVVMEKDGASSAEELSLPVDPVRPEVKESPQVAFEEKKDQVSGSDEEPVEEVLSETGEDPGAVFYMSRVREALAEGNPRFARELLRQMKEAHAESVLVKVAEDLFVESR